MTFVILNLIKLIARKQSITFITLKKKITLEHLELKTPHFLPIIVYNLSYNLFLILKEFDGKRFEVNVNKKKTG